MAAQNALKQYIAARKQLFDAANKPITVVDTIKHIKSLKLYKKMKYKSLHKKISRIFNKIDNNGTLKTPRTCRKPTRTKKIIKLVSNIHAKTKGTKKCSQRKIAYTI
eukprot:196450_1